MTTLPPGPVMGDNSDQLPLCARTIVLTMDASGSDELVASRVKPSVVPDSNVNAAGWQVEVVP
jgi:hypothetical protein